MFTSQFLLESKRRKRNFENRQKSEKKEESRTRDTLSNFFSREIYSHCHFYPSFLFLQPYHIFFFLIPQTAKEDKTGTGVPLTHHSNLPRCYTFVAQPRRTNELKGRTFIPVLHVLWSFQVILSIHLLSPSEKRSKEFLIHPQYHFPLNEFNPVQASSQMAHDSATCLPFTSLSSFLHVLNKDNEEDEVLSSFIEGQIDDSQTPTAIESFESLESTQLLLKSTTATTDTMLPSLPASLSTALNESIPRGLNLSHKVVKKNMSSSLNQVTIIWPVIFLLLISLSIPSQGLELKPPTAEKEVFTGDSFVVTCLTEQPSSPDLRLAWIAPDQREVASVPTAPIYVSEKPDGLQIVFLRHAKKHSGRYLCVQTKVSNFSLSTNFFPSFYWSLFHFLLQFPRVLFPLSPFQSLFPPSPPTRPTPFSLCLPTIPLNLLVVSRCCHSLLLLSTFHLK